MITIAQAEDAFLEGQANFEEWKEDFERNWFQPLGRTLMASVLASMDPETMQKLAEINPDAFAQVMAMFAR